MRILHLITGLDLGGAEMMLYRLCREQQSIGDEPVVISLKSGGKLKKLLEDEDIPVIDLGFPKGKFSIRGFRNLIQQIKIIKPDVIHCWMYHANMIGSFASLFVREQPVIWAIHNTTLSKANSSLLTILIMRIAGFLSFLPDKIVYCSDIARKLHEEYFYSMKKGKFIPNGVDVELFSPNAGYRSAVLNQLGIDSKQFVIGIVGRFDPQKDYHNFVLAANKLMELRNNVQFVMCGTGIDATNNMLSEWINQTTNPDCFHLLGPQMEIQKYHNAFDVFVSSSSYGEAFPIVLAEAMACGVPCVATDIGDASYIIANTGHVVPVKDPHAIAVSVNDILSLPEDEKLTLKIAARTRIEENFSLDKVAQQYKDTYNDVLKDAL